MDLGHCKVCEEDFVCDGDELRCSCGNHYCCEPCQNEAGVKEDHKTGDYTCAYCRGEIIEDSDLLNFILTECEISREEVEDKYREKHKEA